MACDTYCQQATDLPVLTAAQNKSNSTWTFIQDQWKATLQAASKLGILSMVWYFLDLGELHTSSAHMSSSSSSQDRPCWKQPCLPSVSPNFVESAATGPSGLGGNSLLAEEGTQPALLQVHTAMLKVTVEETSMDACLNQPEMDFLLLEIPSHQPSPAPASVGW